MKKPPKKSKKKNRPKQRKVQRPEQPQSEQPKKQPSEKKPEETVRRHSVKTVAGWAGGVLGAFGLVIGIVVGIGAIVGPIWPTYPIVTAGDPSYSNAFSVPFSITNKSIWFAWHDTSFYCTFQEMDLAGNVTIKRGVSSGFEVGDVPPTQTMTFDCNYPFNLEVLGATVAVFVTYQILGVWEIEVGRGPFVWRGDTDPPRWIEGWEATPKAQ